MNSLLIYLFCKRTEKLPNFSKKDVEDVGKLGKFLNVPTSDDSGVFVISLTFSLGIRIVEEMV